jgi:hypothetical protein
MAGKSRDTVSLGSIYSEYTGSSHEIYPTGKSLTALSHRNPHSLAQTEDKIPSECT